MNPVTERFVALFPVFTAPEHLQALRLAYDPLAPRLAPHITLFERFSSEIVRWQLRDDIIARLHDIAPFIVETGPITRPSTNSVAVRITEGNATICTIREKLAGGLLAAAGPATSNYQPQLVLGRDLTENQAQELVTRYQTSNYSFRGKVTQVHVLSITSPWVPEDEFIYQL